MAWHGGGGTRAGPGGVAGPGGAPFAQSPNPPLLQFRCCGVSNYTDWFEVYNATRVPDSCCLEFSESCGLHAPGTWWKAVSLCPPAGCGPGSWGRKADLAAPVTPTLPPAVLRDREDVAPGEPAGCGRLRAVHGPGAGRRDPTPALSLKNRAVGSLDPRQRCRGPPWGLSGTASTGR